MLSDAAPGIAGAVLAAPARLGAVRLVAVDGPSGAGKSTFARSLIAALRERGAEAGLIGTDDFATWDDPVAWWPRLADVLDRLARGVAGGYRAWDWSDGEPRPGAWVAVPVPDVLLVEGVSAGRASIRPRLSRLVWLELPDPALRLARAVARDGESCARQLAAWQRFERGWFAVDRTRHHADDVVAVGSR
ncbi:uridine kinase [Saccharomonospora piscinae]|uniref:Uridine kinase n=1 Tax=Saccharomonospora piscinae TaxID=687388 RepID=A0A1V9A714_SACPI|nr:uridine kinase [Saccharomonospora piscinae]OQO92919.1 uridine kinase [Saccharomonospora piscinae]